MTGAGPIPDRVQPGAAGLPVRGSDLLRVCLVPLFVLLCYQFEWQAWRELMCTFLVKLADWTGIATTRVGPVSFAMHGRVYVFEISCTALDAFFGSIPLLWRTRVTIARNAAFFAAYFAMLTAANLLRLDLGMVAFLKGVPWWIAHEAAAGVCYFGMFLWIARRRGWTGAVAA
jgi:hypothetical protein